MASTAQVQDILTWLERRGTKRNRDGMARYAITAPKVFGVSVGDLRQHARQYRHDHALAEALWRSGWYEARMLAAFVDDAAKVTPAQMDRWARDFDNWAICDTVCFHLFDKTPHAWKKIAKWSSHRDEFVKRAAFALLASVALHDKTAPSRPFYTSLALIEGAAADDRNFVKKGVSWALRGIGKRRDPELRDAALHTAQRLAGSTEPSARWVGRDALKDFRPKTAKRSARAT